MSEADVHVRHDWRLVPVAAAAWAASWIGASGWRPEPEALAAIVVGLGLAAVAAARLGRLWASLVIVVFAVSGLIAGTQAWQRHHNVVAEMAAEAVTATARVRITSEPRTSGSTVVGSASLVWVEGRGRRFEADVPVVLLGFSDAGEALLPLTPGAHHLVRARLGEARPDDAASAVLRVVEVLDRVEDPGPLAAGANAMRAGLREAVAHSPPRQAALVPSLVIGDTAAVDDTMRREFQVTGLTHLMAVSGANLTLMLGVVLAVVRGAGLRGWAVRGAAVAGVAGFVVVCGQDPSVLRAAAMGLVALAGIGVGTGGRSMRALSVAVMGLVWLDPWLARSAGFALSVLACVGIVAIAPRLIAAMAAWSPRWVAEAVAVPLAAQIFTQPVVTAISGEVSLVGVATNALAGPFVGPTTVLGLTAALLSWAPWLAAGPGWAAGWCSQPILWLAEYGASVPTPAWAWPATVAGVAAIGVAAACLVVVLPRLLRHRMGAAAVVVAVVAGSVVRPVPVGWPGEWSVVFCDVGQGDATVLDAGAGAAVLVDAGPEAGPVQACLGSLGVRRVPLLILTHWHSDHTGGSEALIERFRPELILTRPGPRPAWIDAAAAVAGAQIRAVRPGEQLTVGQVRWSTVSGSQPPGATGPETDSEGSPENDASVVGAVDVEGLRILLAGDAEPPGQRAALSAAATHGVPLDAHVLKLPHHGSARQDPRFFAATGAGLAVASAGEDNPYGHPARAAVDLAAGLGMSVARTDTMGSVAVHLEGDRIRMRTWRAATSG